MPACESKLVCRSSRKATVAKTVLIGQAQVLRSLPSLVVDRSGVATLGHAGARTLATSGRVPLVQR